MAEDVEVRIGANAAGLEAGVKQATTTLDGGTSQMIAMMEKLVGASGASTTAVVADQAKMAKAVVASAEESAGAMALMTTRMKESVAQANESLEGLSRGRTVI